MPNSPKPEIFAGGVPGEGKHHEEVNEVVINKGVVFRREPDRKIHEKEHECPHISSKPH